MLETLQIITNFVVIFFALLLFIRAGFYYYYHRKIELHYTDLENGLKNIRNQTIPREIAERQEEYFKETRRPLLESLQRKKDFWSNILMLPK